MFRRRCILRERVVVSALLIAGVTVNRGPMRLIDDRYIVAPRFLLATSTTRRV